MAPVERTARFKRVRLRSPKDFAPGSFRTVEVGRHRVIVGCPRGKFKEGRCTVGTKTQSILHPRSEPNPCFFCGLTKALRGE